jgi:hypothetical protein
VAVLVRHGSRRTEDHALDWADTQLSLLVDSRLLGKQFIATDNVRDLRN